MLTDVIEFLNCPLCGADLAASATSLKCARGHDFAVARQGYANLAPGGSKAFRGDTASMLDARSAFLLAGHYEPIAQVLADVAASRCEAARSGCVVDVGSGTGYFLARVLDRLPGRAGLALDASKYAARRAARAHARAGSVVCDTWQPLPVRDGSAALVLNVFAPRNPPEFRRVLAAGGALLVVTPTQLHLQEMVSPLGLLRVDPQKEARLGGHLSGLFELVESHDIESAMRLTRVDAERLALMGPSAWHTGGSALQEAIAGLPEVSDVTASVTLSVYAVAE